MYRAGKLISPTIKYELTQQYEPMYVRNSPAKFRCEITLVDQLKNQTLSESLKTMYIPKVGHPEQKVNLFNVKIFAIQNKSNQVNRN